jgi:hypothetical protein
MEFQHFRDITGLIALIAPGQIPDDGQVMRPTQFKDHSVSLTHVGIAHPLLTGSERIIDMHVGASLIEDDATAGFRFVQKRFKEAADLPFESIPVKRSRDVER